MKKASKSIDKDIKKKKSNTASLEPYNKLTTDKKESKKTKQSDLSTFGFTKASNDSCLKKVVSLPAFPINKDVSIYSWNLAGLRAVIKKDKLLPFVSVEKPDILCLNETKVDDDLVTKENFQSLLGPEYYGYFNCCTSKKGYSGTAIFTKFEPISIKYGIGIKEHDEEGRVITAEYPDFYLISTYIPNSGEGLKRLDYRVNSWDKAFQAFLINLSQTKHIIWIGDINVCHKEIDIAYPKSNLRSAGFTIEERNSLSEFLDKGFVDTFRVRNPNLVKYSYWSMMGTARLNNKGWRLDYAIVNSNADKFIKESDILTDYLGSDHCPIKVIWSNEIK